MDMLLLVSTESFSDMSQPVFGDREVSNGGTILACYTEQTSNSNIFHTANGTYVFQAIRTRIKGASTAAHACSQSGGGVG